MLCASASRLFVLRSLFSLFQGFHIQVDRSKLRKVFDAIDTDKNGNLSKEEFRVAAQLVTMSQSEEEFAALFDSIDTDKSGTIEFSEFVAALEKVMASSPTDISDDTELAIVQVTWRRLTKGEEGARVFCNALLSDSASDNLFLVKIERQVRMVFRMIGNAIQALDRPDAAKSVLQKMGARHLDFDVGPVLRRARRPVRGAGDCPR